METVTEKAPPSTAIRHQLDAAERDRLAELEPVIEKGLAGFVEVGTALLEINDRRLYRETHSTFQDYVSEKWQMTARRAYQLCAAAEVVKALPENVNHGSQINERQARELAKVEPERRVQVLEVAASKGPVTARAIKEVAKRWNPTLIEQVKAAIPLAPRLDPKQIKLFTGSRETRFEPPTIEDPGLAKVVFSYNGSTYSVWNSKEHLQWLISYMRGQTRQGFGTFLCNCQSFPRGKASWPELSAKQRGKRLMELFQHPELKVRLPATREEVRAAFEAWLAGAGVEEAPV